MADICKSALSTMANANPGNVFPSAGAFAPGLLWLNYSNGTATTMARRWGLFPVGSIT